MQALFLLYRTPTASEEHAREPIRARCQVRWRRQDWSPNFGLSKRVVEPLILDCGHTQLLPVYRALYVLFSSQQVGEMLVSNRGLFIVRSDNSIVSLEVNEILLPARVDLGLKEGSAGVIRLEPGDLGCLSLASSLNCSQPPEFFALVVCAG